MRHKKVLYPAYFGEGDAKYPGLIATEKIEPKEAIITVPSKCAITGRTCYYSDLKYIFDQHPEVFGANLHNGEDNVMLAFVLYQLSMKEKSFWYPVFQTWPRDSDILVTWPEEDLEMLQDDTCLEDMRKLHDEFYNNWN